MADALISLLIETLGSAAFEKIKEELRLIKGVEEEVESLMTTLRDIQAVLDDAEKRQLSDSAVSNWLEKLKDASFDIDDVLDEWMTPSALKSKMEDENAVSVKKKVWLSLLSLCVCSGGGTVDQVRVRHRIAKEMKELNENLDRIAKAKDRFKLERADHHVDSALGAASRMRKITTSLINEKEVCGREVEKEVLVNKLLSRMERSDHGSRGFGVVSIVGIGGLGKTTLAQLAYNHDRVKNHFVSRIWVCVSDPFDEIKVAKDILRGLDRTASNSDVLNDLVQSIHELVEGKKFLLVLDDVWNKRYDKWEELEKSLANGVTGSRILVTTRNEKVAATMRVAKRDMITLENLSDEYCWKIFTHRAFFDRAEEECRQLEEVGRKISEKSKGLPLIAKTLGGLMSDKKTVNQWNTVLNNELWELKDEEEIFAPFLLSYYDLLPSEKRCLLYCSVFPKDYVIGKGILIRMWMSQGFLGCNVNSEEEGEACFESLARRSFFQDFKENEFDGSIESCKMHDIVCDFVKFLTKDEYRVVEKLIDVGADTKQNALNERTRHLTIYMESNKEILSALKYDEKGKTKLRTLFFASSFSSEDQDSLFFYQTRIRTLILSTRVTMLKDIDKLIHLRYLQISGLAVRMDLPDMICDLYNLETLDLRRSECKYLPENIGKLVNLRYLDLSYCHMTTLPDSICNLSKLQTLILFSCMKVERLPENIDKLVNLRYLDLSCNCHVKTLPDSICNLSKLQTLMLYTCTMLERLPEDLGKLVGLRHLNLLCCNKLVGLPKGIASLTGLQTLNIDLRITKDGESYLHVGHLKALHHALKIQRYFVLYGCTNIQNASEAREIGVTNMELLSDLTLVFKCGQQSGETNGIEDHEREILEALQPSPNLKSLEISHYMGTTVTPKWMMSLLNLTSLELQNCRHCTILPPLGKLLSLKTLRIRGEFDMLKEVGPEFLGLENVDEEERKGDNIGEKSSFISFPKLESLYFEKLSQWESWEGNTSATKDTSIVIMPRLIYLYLEHCESLKALPDFLPWATMKELVIMDCKILEPQYQESSGTKWDKISHIPCVDVV